MLSGQHFFLINAMEHIGLVLHRILCKTEERSSILCDLFLTNKSRANLCNNLIGGWIQAALVRVDTNYVCNAGLHQTITQIRIIKINSLLVLDCI